MTSINASFSVQHVLFGEYPRLSSVAIPISKVSCFDVSVLGQVRRDINQINMSAPKLVDKSENQESDQK